MKWNTLSEYRQNVKSYTYNKLMVLLKSIKITESRMADITLLSKHATTQLNPVYDKYRKSAAKEKFLEDMRANYIVWGYGKSLKEKKIEKLPSAEKMKMELGTLIVEKENLYTDYKTAQQEA